MSDVPPPNPPPLPPRPMMPSTYPQNDMYGGVQQYSSYGGMNSGGMGYGSPFGQTGYGQGMYGNQGYGGYGGGYGMQRGGESDFVRLAEERSRGAFQNIETVVAAFGSISMMLESTLNAFHSSFRAIFGVADQFTRLRMQLRGVLETLAAVRFIKWALNKLLILCRIRSARDDAWTNARHEASPSSSAPKPTNKWSILMTALALAGPWLIYRLVQQVMSNVESSRRWARGEDEYYEAKALYDFQAQTPQELSLVKDDRIRVAPKEEQPNVRGWVMASNLSGDQVGLVPNNYIQVTGRRHVSTERIMENAFNNTRSDSASRLSD